jgi:hypothetical protein
MVVVRPQRSRRCAELDQRDGQHSLKWKTRGARVIIDDSTVT